MSGGSGSDGVRECQEGVGVRVSVRVGEGVKE